MGTKRTNIFNFNWQSTTPAPFNVNTPLTGVLTGTMTDSSTIYTNIQNLINTDNQGLEITWTGTPTGTISVYGSVSGINFYSLTFNPVITQPAGAAGGYLIDISQYPWPYMYVAYTNSSGTGALSIWICSKDLN